MIEAVEPENEPEPEEPRPVRISASKPSVLPELTPGATTGVRADEDRQIEIEEASTGGTRNETEKSGLEARRGSYTIEDASSPKDQLRIIFKNTTGFSARRFFSASSCTAQETSRHTDR